MIIADNTAFHKSSAARRWIKSKQYQLLFLPPYLPAFKAIEHYWFPIKSKISQLLDQGESLAIAAEQVLREMSEPIC